MNQNRLSILKDFIGFCRAELNIQTLPKISLLNDKSFVEQNRSFGEYNPQTNTIRVVALNRNLADICRSLAHELCHHRQNELDMIYNEAGETGTDIENDANAMAGILMRDFGKRNVDVYELNTPTPLKESKRDIKFVQPKFDEEWGEAERYPDLFPDKRSYYFLSYIIKGFETEIITLIKERTIALHSYFDINGKNPDTDENLEILSSFHINPSDLGV